MTRRTLAGQRTARLATMLLVLMIGVLAGLPLVAASASHDHSSHGHDDEEPSGGHRHLSGFESFEGDEWPPQMGGLVNDRPVESEPISSDGRADFAHAARGVASVDLGDRYMLIGEGEALDAKGVRRPNVTQAMYYSYDRAETIVITWRDGQLVEIERTPSTAYQPPRTEAEQVDAVALARAELVNAGHHKASELQAYAILALPHADNDLPDESSAYFADRVLYVSFHVDADARPEFAAWVDLTNQVVLLTREESQ